MSESLTNEYKKLRPRIDADSTEFWASCRNHKMALQRCDECDTVRYPPSHHCPECLSDKATWVPVSGKGVVYAAITFYHPPHPAWREETPYNMSLVELTEGPRIWTNVIGIPPDDVKIGMPVEIVYDDVAADLTLPRFRPNS